MQSLRYRGVIYKAASVRTRILVRITAQNFEIEVPKCKFEIEEQDLKELGLDAERIQEIIKSGSGAKYVSTSVPSNRLHKLTAYQKASL